MMSLCHYGEFMTYHYDFAAYHETSHWQTVINSSALITSWEPISGISRYYHATLPHSSMDFINLSSDIKIFFSSPKKDRPSASEASECLRLSCLDNREKRDWPHVLEAFWDKPVEARILWSKFWNFVFRQPTVLASLCISFRVLLKFLRKKIIK